MTAAPCAPSPLVHRVLLPPTVLELVQRLLAPSIVEEFLASRESAVSRRDGLVPGRI